MLEIVCVINIKMYKTSVYTLVNGNM